MLLYNSIQTFLNLMVFQVKFDQFLHPNSDMMFWYFVKQNWANRRLEMLFIKVGLLARHFHTKSYLWRLTWFLASYINFENWKGPIFYHLLLSYQEVLLKWLFSCKNLLNFPWNAIKFHTNLYSKVLTNHPS